MIRTILWIIAGSGLAITAAIANPEQDRIAFSTFYTERFSDTPKAHFIDGIYAIDEASREQWLEIEEFPPYELDVDGGEALYNKIL